ncbi:OmpL47-type beta-barrel domain-containing protein [Actinophytocola sp.]|uniref:OmpL47-type beta-barrel domain-containing protein n=1 Tax=Actinophytocola sp. TaxID=1872138 RepID=UPI002ED2C4A7
MTRRFLAAVAAAVAVLGLVALPASASTPSPASAAPALAAAQTLNFTAGNSQEAYVSFPTTAVAGETTIVFETSEATGNTTGMSHTLTFDTSTPGYNTDVPLNLLANPFDANNGRHEATVNLTPGRYRFFCTIPGHSTMVGEFTVTGGGEDTTPPTVTAQVTGTQDQSGNYVGAATVAVNATDAGSGVDSVEYQLDGGVWQTYSAPFQVTSLGAHTVRYRATDVAGNTSSEGTTSFTVVAGQGQDTTPPTVTANVSGAQNSEGNYIGSATVTVTAADSGSGVASVEYQVNDQGWNPYTAPVQITNPGQYVVLLRATDAAGNVGNGQVSFTVVERPSDTTPPTVSAEVSGEQDAQGNYLDVATVTVAAADTESGVASVEYKLDDGAWTPYTSAVVVNAAGMHMLSYRATDVAGNVSAEGMAHFTVVDQDTTAPTVTGLATGEQDPSGAYIGSAMVVLSATDAGSGVASIEYKLDSANWTVYSEAVQVMAPGAHTVLFRATDRAGNVSAEGTLTFTVVADETDDTPPSVSALVSGTQDANWAYLDGATINMSALDTGSGVASIEYTLDGSPWTVYTSPVAVDSAGTHTFQYRATDRAGNVSAALTGTFTVVESGPGQGPDVCPSSDVRDTVVIGELDTQVANIDTGNGCTINDVINETYEWPDHNAFVRHVKRVTQELVQNGVITTDQRNRIVSAAVNSDVGASATKV